MAQKKLKRGGNTKSTVKRRTVNRTADKPLATGDPTQHQDAKRRLGTFEGAGEHARVGGRTSGIVGQTTKKNRTDNRRKPRS
jgi:hypothetical protein